MKILFIGNSYTYFNDMPKMLYTLAAENGEELEVDSVTCGGRKLYENLNAGDKYNDQITELLKNKSYDVLILQEQSYFALIDPAEFERGVCELASLVGAKRTILYATWGRKIGCDLLEKYSWSSEEMGEKLHAAYSLAAEKCGADLSPVGLCFNCINKESALELYNPDLSHPSRLGTVVGVLCHYKKIFGALPKSYSSLELGPEQASVILETVDKITKA